MVLERETHSLSASTHILARSSQHIHLVNQTEVTLALSVSKGEGSVYSLSSSGTVVMMLTYVALV
jgi:hypothetical protein